MAINTERLKELAKPRDERAHQEFLERWEDKAWLTYSQDIALALHYYMRTSGLTQRELADKMGVMSVYVGKLLKGGENLTLETICKIQAVVGGKLINVEKPYERPNIIQSTQPYVASPEIEFSPVYHRSIRGRNRCLHSNMKVCAYS